MCMVTYVYGTNGAVVRGIGGSGCAGSQWGWVGA